MVAVDEEAAKKAIYDRYDEKKVMIENYPQDLQMRGSVPSVGNSLCTTFGENISSQLSSDPPFLNSNTTSYPRNIQKKKKNNTNFSFENSIEYRTLLQKFSSGVRLPELCSVAKILCTILSGLIEPSRDQKRSFPLLIEWYHNYWDLISPVLPLIQLRDEKDQVIDGRRELIEKYLQSK